MPLGAYREVVLLRRHSSASSRSTCTERVTRGFAKCPVRSTYKRAGQARVSGCCRFQCQFGVRAACAKLPRTVCPATRPRPYHPRLCVDPQGEPRVRVPKARLSGLHIHPTSHEGSRGRPSEVMETSAHQPGDTSLEVAVGGRDIATREAIRQARLPERERTPPTIIAG
jgi:hypothetical protein